jgi:broad specificity phosphatase PhoE
MIHSHHKIVCIVRHGEALHNVECGYQFPDPPLTPRGLEQAAAITVDFKPDLIVASPMRRTIQTALVAFGSCPLEIWPDLRETYDGICQHGSPISVLQHEFPHLNFSECDDNWTYEPYTHERAEKRAERERRRVREHPAQNIVLVTHRGFIGYLVERPKFRNCEIELFNFASVEKALARYGKNYDGVPTDYGPNVLSPADVSNTSSNDDPLEVAVDVGNCDATSWSSDK